MQAIGKFPAYNANTIVLSRDYSHHYQAFLFDIKDRAAICGVRGDIVIGLEDFTEQEMSEIIRPFLCANIKPNEPEQDLILFHNNKKEVLYKASRK